MDVSIIIPSYNRYPFNLLSLNALEQQNFDFSKMEVILVDDASTDKTPLLKNYRFSYRFIYIRNKKNLGLASTRNKGLNKAKGKVVIFLDAEMVVDPNYVKNNYRHHIKNEKVVVIGGEGGERLYSFLFSGFNTRQIKKLNSLLKKSELVNKRIAKEADIEGSITNIQPILSHLKSPLTLIHKEDIQHFSILKSFSVPKKNVRNILAQIGDHLYESPIAWMACFGNLSLRKSFAREVGGFDEEYKEWGSEDAEFSYRLYKAGAKFIVDPKLKRFHQEHPEPENKKKEWKRNILLFQKKHLVIDVCIRSLKSIYEVDYKFMEKVIQEHHSLSKDFPHFEEFKESVVLLLHQICILEAENKPVQSLMENCSFFDNLSKKERIMNERAQIKSSGKYNNLINIFDILASK